MSAAPADHSEPVAVPQCIRALEYANRIRLARASLKRSIGAGDADAAQTVVDCPREVESMEIGELLRSQRSWGRTRTRRFLTALRISENKRIAALTHRQRTLVATGLREHRQEPSDPLESRVRRPTAFA